MTPRLAAGLSGALFGAGLALSGMTRPEKVVGFLDLGGSWDASLAFVMMGAIGVHFAAQRLARRRAAPLFDSTFHWPASTAIDRSLIAGAALFGIGWGLGGFCPGPGLVSAAAGSPTAIVFAIAMTVGILAYRALASRRAPPAV